MIICWNDGMDPGSIIGLPSYPFTPFGMTKDEG
jgi:hypothetical protein